MELIPGKLYEVTRFTFWDRKKFFEYFDYLYDYMEIKLIEVPLDIDEKIVVMHVNCPEDQYKNYANVLYKDKVIIVRVSCLAEINQ